MEDLKNYQLQLDKLFSNQAGTGISPFQGKRYQTGFGWWGKILKHLKPAMHYIQRKGFDTLTNIGKDFLNGENIIDSGRKQLFNTAQGVLNDATESLENLKKKQKGSGRGKKDAKPKANTKPKIKPKSKTKEIPNRSYIRGVVKSNSLSKGFNFY